jgi:hypothetical protein
MREGLDTPTHQLPADNVDEIRAFLDGQSRITLAVWVRHEQQGPDGPLYDHHLMLGVDDRDWETGDMRALDQGMRVPVLRLGGPTWIDLFPLAEAGPLRSFGTLLWERTDEPGDDLDPLDFRFTREPVTFPAEAVSEFQARMRDVAPDVRRVTARRTRLWKGEAELEDDTVLSVVWDFEREAPPGPLQPVLDAAREAGIEHDGGELRRPQDAESGETVLYDAGEVQ